MNLKNLLNVFLKHKKQLEGFVVVVLFLFLSIVYIFPVLQGLVLLPLDLLISNYLPWYSPGTILLKNNYMQDSIVQMYPWRHLVFDSLVNGIIPFWNPYQFMGAPFLASMKPLIFYPTNLLFVFGEVTSWNLLLLLQIFMSLCFSYLLVRSFKLSIIPSVLSSISFSLSSLMIGVLEFGSEGHVILWIPLFLYSAKNYIDKQDGRYLLLLGISIALSIFAGQLQYSGYGLILLLLFILFYGFSKKLQFTRYIPLFLSIFLGVGLTSVLLVPAFELFRNSHRGLIDSTNVFGSGLMNPVLLLRLFSPDFFGSPVTRNLAVGYIETSGYYGVVALFFTIFAIIFARKNLFVKFFSFVFVISILFSFKYIGSIIYFLKIPLITSGSGGRIFMLVLLSGAVLCGFGLYEFIKTKNIKNLIISLVTFCLVIALIVGIKIISIGNADLTREFIHNIKFSLYAISFFFVISTAYLIFRKKLKYSDTIFSILIVLITFTELFIFGYRFLTFSNTKFLYPELPMTKFVNDYSKDNLTRAFGASEPEISTYLKIYSVETYNPLYLEKTANLLQSLQGKEQGKLTEDNKYFLTKNERLKDVLDFLGVGLVVGGKDGNPSIDYFLTGKYQSSFYDIHKDELFKVYVNKESFPRFYLVYDYRVLSEDDALLSLSKDLSVFRKQIILDSSLPIKLDKGTGSAVLLESNVNYQEYKVNTTSNALLYVSDTYYPGWSVKINGGFEKIYKANYNFRAVVVPKGESIVEFSYQPSNFRLAIALSIISLIGLLIIVIFFPKFKNKENV